MACTNCNPNCFDQTGDDCIETKVSSSSLGIEQSESLNSVLGKIITKLETLSAAQSTSGDEQGGFEQVSLSEKTMSENTMSIGVSPGTSSTLVEYDASDVFESLKGKYFISINVYGSVSGITGRIYTSSSSTGSFNAAPENFPITFSVEANTIEDSGGKVYTLRKQINNATANYAEYFSVENISGSEITSQEEYNKRIADEISNLTFAIKALEKLNINGTVGLSSILSDFEFRIDNLENS